MPRNPVNRTTGSLLAILTVLFCSTPLQARITRVEISRVESPTFEGAEFGGAGKYEKLAGRAFGEVDPADPRNALIVDIKLAPKNDRGMVEYSTDVYILRPVDPAKRNHRVFFDINNRGGSRAIETFNDAKGGINDPSKAADVGNGFLMRQGYTIVWCGWDTTVTAGAGRFTIAVPVAKNADGSDIVGPSLEEFVIDDEPMMKGSLTYPAASLDKSKANLTMRVRYEDKPSVVPATEWDYIDAKAIRLLPAGTPFRAGTLYEFVYPASKPLVAGLGLAAIRDVAAFLLHPDKNEQNPLRDDLRFAYSFCVSQPCRTMHDFLRLGFNEDEQGRRVFNGILNWIGGGSGIFLNYRFAQPGRTHRQHIARWYPEYQFPFTNEIIFDPVTGKTDGWLRRCLKSHTCPNIFEINSENEYWAKAGSVFQLDGSGKDLGDLPNVRSYFMASLPHMSASGPGICQQPRNPLTPNPVLRALLIALDEWVSGDKEPPPSRMARRADGTLVAPTSQSAVGFPAIPGVKYNGRLHTGDRFDFGLHFDDGILTVLPPVLLGTPYPVLVPKTDADGNDLAGIRLPEVAVPLATYSGWGLRANAGDEGCDAAGQMIAFQPTKSAREATGDPRPSIQERYPNQESYVAKIEAAAEELRRQRLLLDEDVQRYLENAKKSSVVK